MSKRAFTFLIIGILAIFAIIGWYIFGRATAPSSQTDANNPNNLFPFGQGPNSTSTKPTTSGGTNGGTVIDLGGPNAASRSPRLRQITNVPTAGIVAFDRNVASSTTVYIRYVERATGHIFETPSESTEFDQISSVTLPKIYEARWGADGSKLIMRYLKDDESTIRSFYGRISSSSPQIALEGLFLPDNLQSLSVFGDKVFYLNENDVSATGIVANIDNSKKANVFSSTFGDWTGVWSGPSTITIYPRPSGLARGTAYALNAGTGQYTAAISNVLGLAALVNADASLVIYSGAERTSIGSAIGSLKDFSTRNVGLATLADKCVWSQKQKNIVYCAVPKRVPNGLYPDDWYKGKVQFDDEVWMINGSTGETRSVFDPSLEAGVSMDMTDLSLDQSETVMVFTSKGDMTTWRYRLVD